MCSMVGMMVHRFILMCFAPGVYVTLVSFLVYFFCERLSYSQKYDMTTSTRDEGKEADFI
jgi:hypothetical protein